MNKIRAYLNRLSKECPTRWVGRHAAARAKLWQRLFASTPSERRLAQAERAMQRLTSLAMPWERWDHRLYSLLTVPIRLFPR